MAEPPQPIDYETRVQPTARLCDLVVKPYVKSFAVGACLGWVVLAMWTLNVPDPPIGACAVPIGAAFYGCIAGLLLTFGFRLFGFRYGSAYFGTPSMWLVWTVGLLHSGMLVVMPQILAWMFGASSVVFGTIVDWVLITVAVGGLISAVVVLRPRGLQE